MNTAIIKKTTPHHIWKLSIPVDTISKIEAYYSQNDKLLFKKTTSDFVLKENTASVKLTSEETLLFDEKLSVEIQLMVKTVNDDIIGTKPKIISVIKCLCDEVIE